MIPGLVIALSLFGLWRWRLPILWLPIFVSASLVIGEAYPFSDFPMYSDPNESENYLYVEAIQADGSRSPIAINHVIGITAPKVKKMYKARLSALAGSKNIETKELGEADLTQTGKELLDYLRNLNETRDSPPPLPERLALVDYWITADPAGGFDETPSVIYSE